MKSIRIGNDIRIEWPIVLSGDVSKLQDLDLTVEVRPSAKIIDTHNYADEIRNNDNKRLLFEKHETTVMMNGGLECRRDIGDGKEHCRPRPPRPCPPRPIPPAPVKLPYHIEDNTLIAMWTADRQFATGDYDIILYAHKNEGGQAVCDQYRFVRLVSHTAQADAPDDSGIEAVIAMQPVTLELSGLSAYEVAVINGFQGTEEEWLASLKKPAEDAAEELKQEIEQFKEDTKEELQADIKALGYYEDNPEFIRAYTDAEGKFLWGIRIDGSIEWAKGVPTPIQNALKELADKIKDLGGDKIEEVETALNEKIEALQDAIDVINASLKTLTDTFSYQDNPEFVNVVTDAEGKVLFGIKEDGKPYFPKNEMYSVESNQEFLAAWLDSAGHVLFGLRTDGSTYVAKADFMDKIAKIEQMLKDGGFDDSEIKEQVTALQENVDTLSSDVENIKDTTDSHTTSISELQDSVNELQQGNEAMQMLSVIDDVEERTEITTDAENKVLSYRDKSGIKHEEKLALNEVFDKDGNKMNIAVKEDIPKLTDVKLAELDGVQDHSLPNLFNKDAIRTYDSDFADKVFAKIGRKTAETGCYSNNIECKEGDWFTRSDFGTGIVVVLDENENILGDVANAAYQPTIQITPSDPSKYDFSTAKYVVFVVMLENLTSERIVKAKYIPTDEGDYVTIPKLKVLSDNMDKDTTTYIKSNSGRYYQLQIDDSGESPILTPVALEGIPASELPSDFPTFKITGDFSKYYDGLVLCPIQGGVTEYLYELAPNGLVKRYLKTKVNCPRILKENHELYVYGVNGNLNTSSGKLNIYRTKDESFEVVRGDLGAVSGGYIEPHDCLVLSVNPLHYICQIYVPNTIVDSGTTSKIALHIQEIYEDTLVSEWKSENYPELWTDSHDYWDDDYLHNNTICIGPDNNLYLNNKHANQILVIERTWDNFSHTGHLGDILWKIGGNRAKATWDSPIRIKTTEQQQWFESHDAIINSEGQITMFDNQESNPSRILEFGIDYESKQLKDFQAFTWMQYRGRVMGSVDKCAENIYLVSWGGTRNGNAANAGIYDFNTNKAIFEIRFDATGSSAYRIYGIPKV
jgi:methyl-accepting chemotaxis protein